MNLWAIAAIVIAGIAGAAGIIAYHEIEVSNAFDRGEAKGIASERARAQTALDREIEEVRKDVARNSALPESELDLRFRCIRARVRGEAATPDCQRVLPDLPARPPR